MPRNRVWLFGALLGLSVLLVAAPVSAWEYSMTGNFEWSYLLVAQGGRNGFFGPQNAVNPALLAAGLAPNAANINWNGMNTWVGSRLLSGTQFGLVSGEDASWQYMRMTLTPEFRVNPAVRVRGLYWIGAFNNYNFSSGAVGNAFDQASATWAPSLGTNTDLASGYYLNQQTGSAITRPIATGQWNQLWATAQTPWGILTFGKRPSGFGMGLAVDGERTTHSESLSLIAQYGPLRIGWSMHPWRQYSFYDTFRNINFGGSSLTAPTAAVGRFASNTTGTRYQKLWDTGGIRLQLPQVGAFVTCSNGPLDAGVSCQYYQGHQGPEHVGTLTSGLGSNANAFNRMPTIDQSYQDSVMYVKYNNGRFFFNAELDYTRWEARFQPGLINFDPAQVDAFGLGAGSVYQPVNMESWQWATEFGLLCGPSKLAFLYAYIPGPDWRDGMWISQSNWYNSSYGQSNGNAPLFLPYSYLLGFTYGTGLCGAWRDAMGGSGITSATVAATRLDYAIAANLNWYGTFLWAWRTGGWPVGVLTINPGTVVIPNGTAIATLSHGGSNSVDIFGFTNTEAFPGTAAVGVPSIPDNNLGWEITTGVDWKLLEGLVLNLRGAYWQPGEWFKFACVDKTIATGITAAGRINPLSGGANAVLFAANGTPLAVNPSKSIDPIWAFTAVMNVDF